MPRIVPQPSNVGLRQMVKAVVRLHSLDGVSQGSGFLVLHKARLIVTAAHVVPTGAQRVIVRTPSGISKQVDVLRRDAATDIAILSDHPDLDDGFNANLQDASEIGVGDEVWLAGFPNGWDATTPVFSRGIVAGVGSETWLNIEANWGQSGGPVFTMKEGDPRIAGIVLGHGGRANAQLEAAIRDLGAVHADLQRLAGQGGQGSIGGLNVKAFAAATAAALHQLGGLVRDHFRSGNVRIAPLQELIAQLA